MNPKKIINRSACEYIICTNFRHQVGVKCMIKERNVYWKQSSHKCWRYTWGYIFYNLGQGLLIPVTENHKFGWCVLLHWWRLCIVTAQNNHGINKGFGPELLHKLGTFPMLVAQCDPKNQQIIVLHIPCLPFQNTPASLKRSGGKKTSQKIISHSQYCNYYLLNFKECPSCYSSQCIIVLVFVKYAAYYCL